MKVTSLRSRAQLWWRKEIRPLLVLALVLCSLRSSLADWSDVPTGSMKPTVLEGDRVYVNKLAYGLAEETAPWTGFGASTIRTNPSAAAGRVA